jgi:hypothetical protein
VFSMTIKTNTTPVLGLGPNTGIAFEKQVLKRFSDEAGKLVEDALHDILGTEEAYVLSPEYAAQKPSIAGYQHVPGKPPDQPLILTAAMFNSIEFEVKGATTTIYFNADKIPENDFDLPAYWEKVTSFMEKAMAKIEDQLPDLMLQIIIQEGML